MATFDYSMQNGASSDAVTRRSTINSFDYQSGFDSDLTVPHMPPDMTPDFYPDFNPDFNPDFSTDLTIIANSNANAIANANANANAIAIANANANGGHDSNMHEAASDLDSGDRSPSASSTVSLKVNTLIYQPTHPLYQREQLVAEGLDYFNTVICRDLISLGSHFNPFKVNMKRITAIPHIYVNILVSAAGFHRLMSYGAEPTSSSALIQKDVDIYTFRDEALMELNKELHKADSQTSDATLLCVIALMMPSPVPRLEPDRAQPPQPAVKIEWRAHLEGARRIIQLRGGLKAIIKRNPYFKPVLTYFMLIDVLSATTTPSTHADMASATLMATRYWEMGQEMFQFICTTAMPFPDELFQVVIMINYLRTIAHRAESRPQLQAGIRVVLARTLAFQPVEYMNRMHGFNGWNLTGNGLDFVREHSPPRTIAPSVAGASTPGGDSQQMQHHYHHHQQHHSHEYHDKHEKHDSHDNHDNHDDHAGQATPASPVSSAGSLDEEVWLSVAVIYRAAVLLYALRTLVVDGADDDMAGLLPSDAHLSVDALRRETREILMGALSSALADTARGRQLGRLIQWPLFLLGMEAGAGDGDAAVRAFVTGGFAWLSHSRGTLGPLAIVEELRAKWAIDASVPDGATVTWDDYFLGRPDFIVF